MDSVHFLDAETEKVRYDHHENTIENEGYVRMFESFIADAVTPFPVKTILDYGSGPGPVLAELLTRKGYSVQTYDPFYDEKDLQKESFDLISSTEVFEHFYDPLKEIEKILPLLKTGGYLSVMTRFAVDQDEFKAWFYKDDDTHVSFYAWKTFAYLAEKFGLDLVKNNAVNVIVLRKN